MNALLYRDMDSSRKSHTDVRTATQSHEAATVLPNACSAEQYGGVNEYWTDLYNV